MQTSFYSSNDKLNNTCLKIIVLVLLFYIFFCTDKHKNIKYDAASIHPASLPLQQK